MRMIFAFVRAAVVGAVPIALGACGGGAPSAGGAATSGAAGTPAAAITMQPEKGEERHLSNIRQLTNGGENAEAYFSGDGKRLIFQSTRDGRTCDLQYTMNIDGSNVHRVSPNAGKTTCGYFYAGDSKIFFASTHAADTVCPPKPDPSKGYVWGLDRFDIYTANPDGSNLQRLTNNGVYTAEGTLSPDGKSIVFTSLKDGDLELYTMGVDGSNVRRLTNAPGYDGGAFFSHDGTQIVYRANHPTDPAELAEYRGLLAQSIVRPNKMEIWVMNADGANQHQITTLGGANFAPYFTPDDTHIIFSSNYKDPHSGNFDLYLIDANGGNLEQVTTQDQFDGFPQFSPDGTKLVWEAGRKSTDARGLNVFIADWRP
jgi:Tol biopolymer transport system component